MAFVLHELEARLHPMDDVEEKHFPGLFDGRLPGIGLEHVHECLDERVAEQLHLMGPRTVRKVPAAQIVQKLWYLGVGLLLRQLQLTHQQVDDARDAHRVVLQLGVELQVLLAQVLQERERLHRLGVLLEQFQVCRQADLQYEGIFTVSLIYEDSSGHFTSNRFFVLTLSYCTTWTAAFRALQRRRFKRTPVNWPFMG